MLRRFIVALLLISFLIAQAVATEYLADVKVQQIQGSDTKTWASPSERTLEIGESWDYGSITIKYNTIESTKDRIWFLITGSSITTHDWVFKEGETWCIRGTDCSDNASNASYNAIRMTLKDIRPSSTSFNGTTSENPVYAYVYINKEISLIKDDVATVDVQKTRQETGVSYSKTTSEVYVYFIRKQSVPISIIVKAESREPKNEEWTSDRVKYTIDTSGTYTFTVKYKKSNTWGAETDITETYGLKLINLGDLTNTGLGVSKYKSTIYLPDTLTVDMGTAGSFTKQDGVSITSLSSSEYRLAFDSAGTYSLKYTTSGGTATDDAVVATVRTSAAQENTQSKETTTANQQQTSDGDDGGNLLYYLLLIIAVIALGYMFLSRRKGAQKYTLHAKAQ